MVSGMTRWGRAALFMNGRDRMARVMHTSDWHLGRTVGRQRLPRDADFDAVLPEITGIARDVRPDLIIHSGDLFDFLRPGALDLARCLHALSDLSEVAPVLVVAGNHDSPVLLEVLEFAMTAFGTTSGRGVPRVKFAVRARLPRDGGVLDYPARGRRAADPGSRAALHPPEQVPGRLRQPGQRHPRLRPPPARYPGRVVPRAPGRMPSRTATSWSSPLTCTSRAPCRPGPSGPSISRTRT